ncbi:MAG: hypothetical protein CMK49_03520 [Prochlorococcus sp. SP3034]|nr:hypothetical protein [Prochlorococcus sp. SP3034]|tara:strand:+ start:3779 stop:4096 length:318 start_codon:yes stop_codon:yes gene_type:complete
MIRAYINNICLIGFALIGPIHLPAGGIQRSIYIEDSQQIVLSSKCSIYCSPHIDSKKLRLIPVGTSLSVLNYWVDSKENRWMRINLTANFLVKNATQPNRGWIKI